MRLEHHLVGGYVRYISPYIIIIIIIKYCKSSRKYCKSSRKYCKSSRKYCKSSRKYCMFMFQDAEANSLCRRLPLQAIITTGMQRLTKYPLLIENLLKYTQRKSILLLRDDTVPLI